MTTVNVGYKLAVSAGYKADIVKMGFSAYDELAYYNKQNFPDIEITRPEISTDLSLLDSKALMTVNGFIYPTAYVGNRLYIPKATGSMLKSKNNHIGILSFNKLDTPLNKHPITAAMITQDGNIPLFEKAIITFDAVISSAFLVIAGYPIFEQPEFFYRVSDRSFALRLDRLKYVERLYELAKYRDIFAELEVPVSPNAPDVVDGGVVRSNETITKFLSLFNSFLVEVPGYRVEPRRVYLEHSTVPNTFRTEIEPVMPLVGGCGKFLEYISKKGAENKFNVYTADSHYNNYLLSHLPPEQIATYNAHRRVGETYGLTEGYFLDIQMSPIPMDHM